MTPPDPLTPPRWAPMLPVERWFILGAFPVMIIAVVVVLFGGPLLLLALPAAVTGASAISQLVRAARVQAWEQCGLAVGTLSIVGFAVAGLITGSMWAFIALAVVGVGGALWQLWVSHYRDGPRLRALAEQINREFGERP